jgi:hypothetical protein
MSRSAPSCWLGARSRLRSLRPLLIAGGVACFLAGCAPGAPPPGPIDLVRKAIDPSYDYTKSPDTWRDADEDDYRRHARRDERSAGCPQDDMTCTHGGVTVCCAPSDRCCAGQSGPYCCGADGAGYGEDPGRWYDDR